MAERFFRLLDEQAVVAYVSDGTREGDGEGCWFYFEWWRGLSQDAFLVSSSPQQAAVLKAAAGCRSLNYDL